MKEKIIAWVQESPVHMALAAVVAVVVLGALVGLIKTVL